MLAQSPLVTPPDSVIVIRKKGNTAQSNHFYCTVNTSSRCEFLSKAAKPRRREGDRDDSQASISVTTEGPTDDSDAPDTRPGGGFLFPILPSFSVRISSATSDSDALPICPMRDYGQL